MINNTITKHPQEKRIPHLTPELMFETLAFPQVVRILYSVREGADDIHSGWQMHPFPNVCVVKDLVTNSKRKDKFETER